MQYLQQKMLVLVSLDVNTWRIKLKNNTGILDNDMRINSNNVKEWIGKILSILNSGLTQVVKLIAIKIGYIYIYIYIYVGLGH